MFILGHSGIDVNGSLLALLVKTLLFHRRPIDLGWKEGLIDNYLVEHVIEGAKILAALIRSRLKARAI